MNPSLSTLTRRTGRALLWLLLLCLVASILAAVGLAVLGPGLQVSLGDHALPVRDLDALDWLITVGALMLSLLIVFTVVPLALAFAGVMVLFALAWAAAPLIFVILLTVWALRRRRAARAADAGVTA